MPTHPQKLTLDAMDSYYHVVDAQIHPDTTCIAFQAGRLTKARGKNARSNIYLADSHSTRAFTSGDASEAHPRWSPDGKWLAFVSDRAKNDVFQLYLIPREGGEAQQLTNASGVHESYRDVMIFKWSPDSTHIAYLQKDAEGEAIQQRHAQGFDEIEFEAKPRFSRVWIVDIATKETRVVTRGAVQTWEFDWSPKGDELVLVCSPLPYEWSWYDTYLARVSLSGRNVGGTPRKIFARPSKQIAHPRWSPDGAHIAFISSALSDRGIISGDVYLVNANGKHARSLSEGYAGSVSGIAWADAQTLLTTGYLEGDAAITKFDIEGAYENVWHASVALQESHTPKFSRAHDGTLAVVRSAPNAPREVWTFDARDPKAFVWTQVSNLNAPFQNIAMGDHEIVHWESVDGRGMQGILVKPVGSKPGKPLPLVVYPHGGPTGITANEFFAPTRWVYHLTNRGFAVFMPNYRGSTGWGIEFTEANLGDMGGLDFQDIMTGVDALIARGSADPKRLGIGGWSYGGFLAAWAITQTDRFKAAVAGAAITNWLSFHGTSYLCAWDALYMKENPYTADGNYKKFSPMAHIAKAKTPTLILHGEKDGDVSVSQGFELYRALKERDVETEMVVYPREPHAISETPHVKDIVSRVCDWFERHLKA